MSSDEPLLKVEDLHVHRGEAHILHGIGFSIPRHSVTALLGRNGVGKTTAILALMGLLPSTGVIEMNGESLQPLAVHQRVQRGIGYVPEDREVFSELTVEENLRLAMRSDAARERLDLVHDVFPALAERKAQRAGTLSGGQQQMLAVGRALLNRNELLLVDEPSKGLAPIVIADMVAALQRAADHTTVLLVEQNLRVARDLADAAVVLDHGEVVHASSMDELMAETELTTALLGVGNIGALS